MGTDSDTTIDTERDSTECSIGDAHFESTGCHGIDFGVSMRWGAGAYVTEARNLVAYAVSRNVEDVTFQGQDDTVCFNQWPRVR